MVYLDPFQVLFHLINLVLKIFSAHIVSLGGGSCISNFLMGISFQFQKAIDILGVSLITVFIKSVEL